MTLQGKWRRRDDGAYVSDAGYVIRRNGPDWSVNRSDTEPIPGFNTHSLLSLAKKRCEQDLSARQGQPSPETRTVMSVGDPGKWQAQYRDREMNLWFDIGDAQQDRADAQAREQEYADRHAAITGNAQRTKECDGCGGVHPVSTLHHERLVDMGSSESDYRCRVCGPLNHQRITSPTAARLAELPEALMAPDLVEAYRAVARDLGARSERAQKDARPRRQFIQSLENARAVVLREAGIEDAL